MTLRQSSIEKSLRTADSNTGIVEDVVDSSMSCKRVIDHLFNRAVIGNVQSYGGDLAVQQGDAFRNLFYSFGIYVGYHDIRARAWPTPLQALSDA